MDPNGDTHIVPPGNTESQEARENKRPSQYIYYSFTFNSYKNNMEMMELTYLLGVLEHECDWYIIQEETGESGNLHLQGSLKLKKKKRLSELFHLNPKIHWEVTQKITASAAYCSRISKRTGNLYTHGFHVPLNQVCKTKEPKGWQLEVMDIINGPVNDRDIWWFWEPIGNVGKSELCKYLVVHHNGLMLSGKNNDIFHMVSKNPDRRKLFIVDIPRCSLEHINYNAIEAIKNGLIFSGKYQGCQIVFDRPHVIVFANEKPHTRSMSLDHWKIVEIKTTQHPSN